MVTGLNNKGTPRLFLAQRSHCSSGGVCHYCCHIAVFGALLCILLPWLGRWTSHRKTWEMRVGRARQGAPLVACSPGANCYCPLPRFPVCGVAVPMQVAGRLKYVKSTSQLSEISKLRPRGPLVVAGALQPMCGDSCPPCPLPGGPLALPSPKTWLTESPFTHLASSPFPPKEGCMVPTQ